MVWVALFQGSATMWKTQTQVTQVHLVCTQINAFVKSLRQTQTPTVVAAPQLLTSLQCQNKGTCSTPTPKCTSDSFFSLQTPQSTEQVNKNQGRHTATRKFQCGYCFTCPRWHCSSVRFGTLDTTPLSRCLDWETRFQVSNTQPSFKGCRNNSKLLWYTNHLVRKRQKHFQKFSSQTGFVQTQITS